MPRTDPKLPVAAGIAAAAMGATARKVVHDHAARREEERRAFCLHDDEDGAEAIGRVAAGQVDNAADELRDADGDLGEAIHEARKALKRARAAVRVGRDAIGSQAYRRENTALRDMGRSLAPPRDAEVVLETLDDLTERYREQLPAGAFAGLRAVLAADARSALEEVRTDSARIAATLAALDASHERLADLDGASGGDDALTTGFRRIYRRGRRALRTAEADPDAENLHELRKRAKDLWHAAQIVRPRASKRIRKVVRRAHKLANALGDDHDLVVLRETAAEREDTLRPGEFELLCAIIRERQDDLRRKALKRARKLYSAKPRRVAGSIRTS